MGRNRQSLQSTAQCRRFIGRFGGRTGNRSAAAVQRFRYRRILAHPGRQMRRGRLSAVARPGPSERKLLGWTPISVVGPMGRDVADTVLQLRATAGMDFTDPLSYPLGGDIFASLPDIDLSQLRIGYTEDFGICEVDNDIRQVFRNKIAAISPHVKVCEEMSVEMGEAHRCFDVIRAESFFAGFEAAYRRDPSSLGPNTRANYELGAAMTLADSAWAQGEQTRIFRRFQTLFNKFDLILSPTTPVSPFPWSELFLKQINGIELENYYRWLALTYVVTLATNPSISLPCGVDHKQMPFGLQVTGAFRADSRLLGCAAALEHLFDGNDELRRPRPDLQQLRRSEVDLTSIVTHPPLQAGQPAENSGVAAV